MHDKFSSSALDTLMSPPCPVMFQGHFTAVILAAGYSSRMGAFKPLLSLTERTALERCVVMFRNAGVDDVRVVIGHRREELRPLLRSMRIRAIDNNHPEQGMFSSVRCALVDIQAAKVDTAKASRSQGCLLLPVDIASVRTHTVVCLLDEWQRREASVILPSFLGKTGHPALLAATAFADILAWDRGNGLHGWMEHRFLAGPTTVPVADAGTLMDMDTPDDATRMAERLNRTLDLTIPDAKECLALHRLYDPGPNRRQVRAHCLSVARVAVRLGATLLQAKRGISLEILASAALLHDIAKGQPDHARLGGEFLRHQGFSSVAGIIAEHHDAHALAADEVNASFLLCVADQLVVEDRLEGLQKRFAATLRRFCHDPEALRAIRTKQGAAQRAVKHLERIIGQDPETAASKPVQVESVLLQGFAP